MQMTVDGGRTMETRAPRSRSTTTFTRSAGRPQQDPDHVLAAIGGDGGIGVSYDMAKTWIFEADLPVGLFYHVGYDMENSVQRLRGHAGDNYDWCGPSATRQSVAILKSDWFQIENGD